MKSWIGFAVVWVAAVCAVGAAEDVTAEQVLSVLQKARVDAAAGELQRREDLDAVAETYAGAIAALPHRERLAYGESIESQLEAAGVTRYRQAASHLDLVRGYPRPSDGLLKSWRNYERAWSAALDPRMDAVGVASHVADDGWVILAVVFLEEVVVPTDLQALERSTIDAVNEVRVEHGLRPLTENESLARVARRHSEEMARYDFFSHKGRDGSQVADRVRGEHIGYITVAENIQTNKGYDDPVLVAVESWMDSKGHRKNILDGGFRQTAVGVAMTEDATYYFTQLFLLSGDEEDAGSP